MFRRASVWRFLTSSILAALVAAAIVPSARAQSATGSIEGAVVDQTGAVMPGVTVTVVQTATGLHEDRGLRRRMASSAFRCCRPACTTSPPSSRVSLRASCPS